jgi:arginase family enzyme
VDGPVSALVPVALLDRVSDRGPEEAQGARELAELLGAPVRGAPGGYREASFEEELRDGREALREAAALVDEALGAGRRPLLLAPDCSVALTTLPAALRVHPDAGLLWLDAHPDFHTPETTASRYLGGMALSGACGLWDAGVGDGPALDPRRVVLGGLRDVDAPEAELLAGAGPRRLEEGGLDALASGPVWLHLDLDVLDPGIVPVRFPAPGGWDAGRLRAVLAELAERCDVVGGEVTSHAPGHAALVRDALAPLLRA